MTTSVELAAVIITLNEAAHVVACIESLRWADRVVVFDGFSSDETASLARAAGAAVAQSHFRDFAQQRNAALDSLQSNWVFFVDADERGTPELAAEVREVMAGRPEAGWYVPRYNYIFGRLTQGAGWFPDYQLRLFRHGRVRYERPVHEIAVVDGEIGYLRSPLLHYNYRDPAHFHAKQRAYTEYDAGILRQQGVRPKPYTPYTQPLRHFWWRFVTLGGYRDGRHGLRLSLYMAYYESVKYHKLARLWREM
ncbi:MAG: glycosyltransferase family 2 protein [Chloroflexi bacterium]|nr:glycosyltransferase family 2 protein [Chloroflexota bacterium]MCI0645601.1 glycosyltransferase family 2 protein [Chloroflexota bacterium]